MDNEPIKVGDDARIRLTLEDPDTGKKIIGGVTEVTVNVQPPENATPVLYTLTLGQVIKKDEATYDLIVRMTVDDVWTWSAWSDGVRGRANGSIAVAPDPLYIPS